MALAPSHPRIGWIDAPHKRLTIAASVIFRTCQRHFAPRLLTLPSDLCLSCLPIAHHSPEGLLGRVHVIAHERSPFPGDYGRALVPYITDGVSRLQTNKYTSTCWPYCHGHAFPPSWLKACNPARTGGAHDHHGFYHGVVL